MTNYLHKVLPPQYSHVNKVYCLLAATVFCALPLCSTEAAAENILKYDGTTNIHGNAKTWAAKNEYDGIDIRVTGVDGGYYTDTTEALVLNNQTLNVKGKGKFVLSYLLKIRAATSRDIQISSIYPVIPFN